MKKTLYSLMLSDDVMREIDLLAHKMGTNRSSLVNRILAEHVSVRTPEQQANDIFSGIEQLLAASRDLVPALCSQYRARCRALQPCVQISSDAQV